MEPILMKKSERVLNEYEVRIKLFGPVELENQWGRVVENRARQPLSWLLLKYLLVESGREVSLDELLDTVWPHSETDDANAARVRLKRLRLILESIHLGGTKGLVLFSAGNYMLNPQYELKTDTDAFEDLVRRISQCQMEDAAGLQYCIQALELFRGQYLEYTENHFWLTKYQEYYIREFSALVQTTLERTKEIGSEAAIPLLCGRSAALIPEDECFHKELIQYLVEQKRELELIRHISQLTRSGKAPWLDSEALDRL